MRSYKKSNGHNIDFWALKRIARFRHIIGHFLNFPVFQVHFLTIWNLKSAFLCWSNIGWNLPNAISVHKADFFIFTKKPKKMYEDPKNNDPECLIKQAKITRFGRAEWKLAKNAIYKNAICATAHYRTFVNFSVVIIDRLESPQKNYMCAFMLSCSNWIFVNGIFRRFSLSPTKLSYLFCFIKQISHKWL